METLSWGRGQGTDARCPPGPWSDHPLHQTDGAWGSCLAGLLLRTAGSHSHVIKWSCSVCVCVCVCTRSCPTLCSPLDRSPPGPSVRGILQARILEWVAMPSSRGSPRPEGRACVS